MNQLDGLRIIGCDTKDMPEKSMCSYASGCCEWMLFDSSEGAIIFNGERIALNRPIMLIVNPGDVIMAKAPCRCLRACWFSQPSDQLSQLQCVFLSEETASECRSLMESVRRRLRHRAGLERRLIAADMLKISSIVLTVAEQEKSSYQLERAGLADLMMDWMEAHPDAELPMEQMARETGRSRSYLYQVFSEQTGTTPRQFHENMKIEKARVLLAATSMNLAEVAARCGFSSPAYFTKVFGREVGMTPSEYRIRRR